MSDEARAALKWWRGISHKYKWADGSDHKFARLADAYAAEHPADEDEPITPEWLNGLLPWDDVIEGTGLSQVWSIYHNGHELAVDGPSDDWFVLSINEHSWPRPLYTRGQLLRLLKELEQ